MSHFQITKHIEKMMLRTDFLFEGVHPASLAFTRILFGFLMLFDIPDERGGAVIDIRWGDPQGCNFPLFSSMPRPSYPWMCLFYGIMWHGALGICLGYKFRISCAAYIVPYWYILLLDKSFWNNHSYLYGLLAILLSTSSAGDYWSIDAYFNNKTNKNKALRATDTDNNDLHQKQNGDIPSVPFWNYFILRFQVFCLYFIAGLKKLDMEWLDGYSMRNVGQHWVFNPFMLILTTEQIDYLIIHIAGFLLDLTVGFFLLNKKTRPFALLFCGVFHLMNSRLFSIGMFPYVCIATMPIFCAPDWPENLYYKAKMMAFRNRAAVQLKSPKPSETKKSKLTLVLIVSYCCVQSFLPWSHFITKGYNNWTNGLYGYSWDMMVHSWDTTMIIVQIIDNENGKEMFLDPSAWVHNNRWNKHADMTIQYAKCVENNFITDITNRNLIDSPENEISPIISNNLSIYVDVWCSLNGRFQQRMFDPHYDLLKANWSPFSNVEWLLPLLIEYSDLREKMKSIQEHVYSWSNDSEVLFVADFPDFYLENFISKDLINISLTIIEGSVLFETENSPESILLKQGDSISIKSNIFHKVKTVSKTPSCFMYTFLNGTRDESIETNEDEDLKSVPSPVPLLEDGLETIASLKSMFSLIGNALLYIFYDVPIMRRERVDY